MMITEAVAVWNTMDRMTYKWPSNAKVSVSVVSTISTVKFDFKQRLGNGANVTAWLYL